MASYGYEPPEDDASVGGWRETWAILKVVIAVLAPPLLIVFGTVGLITATLMLLLVNPPLALIPVALLGGGATILIRRDRRIADEAEERIFGGE